ncbi:Troponin isoform 2 [Oopsacas minuta]|uniref:Troponin isoform 2 n=1 Tax=Oopsacas minuta TaxID=111878 RepID=A0AAV7JFQ0_9METZ|nr:Troponin isoform 2 [Oopsacas minuta]
MAELNYALNADQLSELQAMFLWLDKENNSFIKVEDLENFLVSWRKIVSIDDVKKLIEVSDLDKSGRVEFHLFSNVVVEFDKIFKAELYKELSSTFRKIDDNRTGYVKVEDVLTVFKTNEYSVSIDYVITIINQINPSNNELVNYKNFIESFIC